MVNASITSWHRSCLSKVNINLKIDHHQEKKNFFFLFKAYLLLNRNVNRILWDDILWILFYILWLCENWKIHSSPLLALQNGCKNLISSIWNESNSASPKICFYSSKTCNHPKVHSHCNLSGSVLSLRKIHVDWKNSPVWLLKTKWPSLAYNWVRQLIKAGSYGHYGRKMPHPTCKNGSKVIVLDWALQIIFLLNLPRLIILANT